jgi:hypothetical protein
MRLLALIFVLILAVMFYNGNDKTEGQSAPSASHTYPPKEPTSTTAQSGRTATPEAPKPEPPMVATPDSVARKVLNGSKESAASAEIEVDGDTLFVRYSMTPWSMTIDWTHSIFELHVNDFVKSESEHFPYLMNIKVTAYGQFRDIRGNESTKDILAAVFTRKNADTIKWGSIAYRDIPLLADDYWIHPQLERKKK